MYNYWSQKNAGTNLLHNQPFIPMTECGSKQDPSMRSAKMGELTAKVKRVMDIIKVNHFGILQHSWRLVHLKLYLMWKQMQVGIFCSESLMLMMKGLSGPDRWNWRPIVVVTKTHLVLDCLYSRNSCCICCLISRCNSFLHPFVHLSRIKCLLSSFLCFLLITHLN